VTAQPWEPRLARLEGVYEQVDKRLDSIDRRLDTLERKIDTKVDGLDRKIDGLRWQMTSILLGTWMTVMLAIFFHKP